MLPQNARFLRAGFKAVYAASAIIDLAPLLLNRGRLQIAAIAMDGVNAIYAGAIKGLA
jgi:hypothetical protein